MHGAIVSLRAKPQQRDALIAVLIDGVQSFRGCISFVVAKDVEDENLIWVSEIWDCKESHKAAFNASAALGERVNPLLDTSAEITHQYIEPIGGVGLGQ